MAQSRPEGMPVDEFDTRPLPIIGQFNVQRFRQFGPEDTANWFIVSGEDTKRSYSMYPTMGRAHVSFLGNNVLIFPAEPRGLFDTISFWYSVVGNTVFRIDENYNVVNIGTLETTSGNVFFDYLVVNKIVFACFVDSQKIYIYREDTGLFSVILDSNAPGNAITYDSAGIPSITKPGFIVAFGNRIAVSVADSSQFYLSEINLLTSNNTGVATFEPDYVFTVGTVLDHASPGESVVVQGAAVFAQEEGIIRQMGAVNNVLCIFTDYTTGIWSNIPSTFSATQVTFPWKKSTSSSWNYGMADSLSLDIDFGFLAFLAQSDDGLLQMMVSGGGQPEKISSKAVDVLLQRYSNLFGNNSPFLSGNAIGFLYQYENTVFYRLSGGMVTNTGLLDQEINENSLEYNFDVKEWHRCIELNGERNKIQRHIFFNHQHLVTVLGESTVYQMGGQFYTNEIRNPDQSNVQAEDAYLMLPFRYERLTPIISERDYAEFETQYAEIDFVFGESNINFSEGPFPNTQFIIDEVAGSDGNPQYVIDEELGTDGEPVFMITEGTNIPLVNDVIYNTSFKPTIELYYSDDGGISFLSADVREFSQMGVYQWRMRWYQLGTSRNRVYKLIAVSPVPIVVLGGTMMVRRISGGAN